jgi:hypothetical protein
VAQLGHPGGPFGSPGVCCGWGGPQRAPPSPDDRVTAKSEASHHGRAADDLGRAEGIAEQHDSDGSADKGLQVEERAGDGCRDPALREGEQRHRQDRPCQHESRGGQHRRGGRGRDLRGPACERRRKHGDRCRHELQCRHRDRIPAAQQPRLRHGKPSRGELGGQHQAVAGEARTRAPPGGDDGHPGQRQTEAEPGDRPRQAVPEHAGQHGHQDGGGPDQQRGVRHAGPLDAEVLQQYRSAIPGRAGDENGRAGRAAQPRPADDREHGGGEGKPRERQPSWR